MIKKSPRAIILYLILLVNYNKYITNKEYLRLRQIYFIIYYVS